jgi:peptidoglycan/LPS O-acetylase OafA/YrhL
VGAALSVLSFALPLAACASLVVRFGRSQGVERQQLKWFAYAAALLVATSLLLVLLPLTPTANNLTIGLLTVLLPIAAGIAILRYRLYDLDRLINRTLVYGLLTALLAGVSASVVLILGPVFGRIGAEPPSWAVARATLAVAALLQPARHRIKQR